MRLPDFVIIGAMKAATTTLHAQLSRQPGVYMSEPKEPCFFSDDDVWARGLDWYARLFRSAPPDARCGESSTHYTKLPAYPDTVARMHATLPGARLIYVMRHPVDRLVSHYIHEWTEGRVSGGIDAAVERHRELIDYGRYAFQLEPWVAAYGADRVLPVFFERMRSRGDEELRRIASFLGLDGPVKWRDGENENVSSDRLRKGPLLRFIMNTPVVSRVRRGLVPVGAREWVKNRFFRMRERPGLSGQRLREVERDFDEDLARLSAMLALDPPLTCRNFAQMAESIEDPRLSRVGARPVPGVAGGMA